MSKGLMVLEDTVLYQFLGADGIAELKSKVIDVIVGEIQSQLRESDNYIISPNDIANDVYMDVIENIRKDIIEEYKEKICDAVEKKMNDIF